jgi:hypothetical protein
MSSIHSRIKLVGFTLLIAVLVALGYTILHEGGHALAGLAFGGSVKEFDVNFLNMGAHVRMTGGFSRFQNAVINVSGVGLPLLSWLVLMLLLPKQCSPPLQWTKFITSAGTLCSLLAWVILPLLYLNNSAPAGDDVTKFIGNSGLPPLLVTFTALAFFIGGWTLFTQRFSGTREVLRSLFTENGRPMPIWRWALAGLVVSAALAGAGMLVRSTLGSELAQVPNDSNQIAIVDLSGRDMQSETIARFHLDEAGDASIFLRLINIDSRYLDLNLVPPQGDALLLLHGVDLSSAASASQYQYRLPAGDYHLTLTSVRSPGILKIYLRLP